MNDRILKIQNSLSCDLFLIDDPINLYYLIGLSLSAGKLMITKDSVLLSVDGRYFASCTKHCSFPVILGESLDKVLKDHFPAIKTIGFNSQKTSYKSFQEMQNALPGIDLKPVDGVVEQIRAIKDKNEIDLLRQAAKLAKEGFIFASSLLSEGISENEIATQLEIFWKQHGGKKPSFDPIIAFGSNSAMPHYRAGETRLKKEDCALIDIGVELNHYHSDMTRVLFLGKPNPEIKKIYSIVQKAKDAALEICRPGTLIGDLDNAARDVITKYGYGDKFIHSLGHGIGLEIHEFPFLRNSSPYQNIPLQAGMVITIEPGIYLPGVGGVRLEDTVVVTSSGCEIIT